MDAWEATGEVRLRLDRGRSLAVDSRMLREVGFFFDRSIHGQIIQLIDGGRSRACAQVL